MPAASSSPGRETVLSSHVIRTRVRYLTPFRILKPHATRRSSRSGHAAESAADPDRVPTTRVALRDRCLLRTTRLWHR
jgi:hypothetical protein